MSTQRCQPLAGKMFLAFTGLTLTAATTCIPWPHDERRLAGTWSGVLHAEATMAVSSEGPADVDNPDATQYSLDTPVTITFDAHGVPDKLIVYGLASQGSWGPQLMDVAPQAAEIPAVHAGQTAEVTIDFVPYTVTVREACYSPTEAQVVLEVTTSWDRPQFTNTTIGRMIGEGSCTQYIVGYSVREGPSLHWQQNFLGTTHANVTWRPRGIDTATIIREYWSAQRLTAGGRLTQPSAD